MHGPHLRRAGRRRDPDLPLGRVINFALGEMGALVRRAVRAARRSTGTGPSTPPSSLHGRAGAALRRGCSSWRSCAACSPRRGSCCSSRRSAPRSCCCSSSSSCPTSPVRPFPTAFSEHWTIGGVIVRGRALVVLVVIPLLVVALAWFLNRTKLRARHPGLGRQPRRRPARRHQHQAHLDARVGARRRARRGGRDADRPAGRGHVASTAELGPGMLLRALAAALIGGMASLPLALVAASPSASARRALLQQPDRPAACSTASCFVVVLVALLVVSMRHRGLGERERFSFAPRIRPIPAGARDGSGGSATTPARRRPGAGGRRRRCRSLVTSPSRHFLYARVLAAGAGRAVAHRAHRLGRPALARAVRVRRRRRHDAPTACVQHRLAFPRRARRWRRHPALAAIVVGAPALRMRGLFLAVTTLAFARGVAVAAVPAHLQRPRPLLAAAAAARRRRAVARVPAHLLLRCASRCWCSPSSCVARVRRSGLGRSLLAVRDNELAAAAFGISPTRVKLIAFAVSGGAGRAGRRPARRAARAVHARPTSTATAVARRRRHRRHRRAGLDHGRGARRAVRRRAAGLLPRQPRGRRC